MTCSAAFHTVAPPAAVCLSDSLPHYGAVGGVAQRSAGPEGGPLPGAQASSESKARRLTDEGYSGALDKTTLSKE